MFDGVCKDDCNDCMAACPTHAITRPSGKTSPTLDTDRCLFCRACEADSNVLGTPAWDMGRFGIGFVASPRHADGLPITGPVTGNMRLALEKTYAAVPDPEVVIAVGACAISGGPYAGHAEQYNDAASIVPVDLFIPGCPPHPLTTLDGRLCFLGRI